VIVDRDPGRGLDAVEQVRRQLLALGGGERHRLVKELHHRGHV